jgi:hypothetical protein
MRKQDTIRPPYPRPVRWWSNLRASIAGRRDARAHAKPDPDEHLPYTRRLGAYSHRGYTEAGHWLFRQIKPIDQGIASAGEAVVDTRRVLARIDARFDQIDQSLSSSTPERLVNLEREKERLLHQKEGEFKRASSAAAQLAQLISERQNSEELARSAAAAWETRYRVLRDSFARGYSRRNLDSPIAPAPSIPPFLHWTAGDLPLVVPIIDTEVGDVIRIAAASTSLTSTHG